MKATVITESRIRSSDVILLSLLWSNLTGSVSSESCDLCCLCSAHSKKSLSLDFYCSLLNFSLRCGSFSTDLNDCASLNSLLPDTAVLYKCILNTLTLISTLLLIYQLLNSSTNRFSSVRVNWRYGLQTSTNGKVSRETEKSAIHTSSLTVRQWMSFR